MRIVRIGWIYTKMVAATLFTGGRVFLYPYLMPGRFRRLANHFTGEWGRLVIRGSGVEVVVRNGERLHPPGGSILVANHRSWFDIFALSAALDHSFVFIGKKEISSIPLVGMVWQKVGHIAIDRSDRQAAVASLERADRLLREGRTIVIFPEGTRSPDGRLGRFKKGAFVIAIRSQVPIIPVAIRGTGRIMKKGSWEIEPGRATISVGKPIATRGLTLADRDALSRRCREEVARRLKEEAEDDC